MKAKFFCSFLFIFILGCTTTYTSGELFPIERIEEIQVGMPQEEVLTILGAPYAEEQYIGGTKWIWSYSTVQKDHTFTVTVVEKIVASRSEYVLYH